MTKAELATIRARCDAATAGPWRWRDYETAVGLVGQICGESFILLPAVEFESEPETDYRYCLKLREGFHMVDFRREHPDAEFIAHARTDIPALLAYIATLERVLEAEGVELARAVTALVEDGRAQR